MKKIKLTELLIFIIGTELVGAISGLIAGDFSSFYNTLEKPALSPPGWIFPIVWTILYALMGISLYLIYTSSADDKSKKKAYTIYAVQLFFNFIWSIIFFRFHLTGLSSIVVVILFILIIAMIAIFKKIRPSAGYLNIPYLLWTAFASYLNIATFLIN